jgi:hypothetical protein
LGRQRPKDPAKVAAGKRRRPWLDEDRQRLRGQCLARQPWQRSTGPTSHEGKRRSASNGHRHRADPNSLRQLKASVADVGGMVAAMADLRRSLTG